MMPKSAQVQGSIPEAGCVTFAMPCVGQRCWPERLEEASDGKGEGFDHIIKAGLNRLPQTGDRRHGDGADPGEVFFELLDRGVALRAATGKK